MCLILRPVFIALSLRYVIALNFFFATKKSANRPLCPLHSYRTQLSFSRVQHFIYYTWTTNFVNYFLYPGIRIFIPRYSGFFQIFCILLHIIFTYANIISLSSQNFFCIFYCFSSIIITCVFHFYNFHSYIHPKKFYHFYRNKKKSPEKPDAMSCVRGHFHTASGENFSLFSI